MKLLETYEDIENDDFDLRFPIAPKIVDGRVVRDHIPNTESISATSNDYRVLRGIREVSMKEFECSSTYRLDDFNKSKKLVLQIEETKEINPLIVMIDEGGPYILEGGHRFDAPCMMKANAFPALVVIDYQD